MKRISHWIDGRIVEGTSGRTGPVWNPATGHAAGRGRLRVAPRRSTPRSTARAAAFPAWRATNLSRRAEVMFHLRELIDANRKEIASLLTAEHGKVLSDALGEVARGLENVEFACGIPHLLKGGALASRRRRASTCTSSASRSAWWPASRPFNFPAMVPMWMFANALACGNTFILKPSEKDPSASLFLAELLHQAGPARRVLQRGERRQGGGRPHPRAPRHRGGELRRARPRSPATSTRPGTAQRQAGAGARRREEPHAGAGRRRPRHGRRRGGVGGLRVGRRAVHGRVGRAGRRRGGRRRWCDRIRTRIPAIVVGPGAEPDSEMGPLITGEHRDKVAGYVDGAPGEGATVVVDGRDGASGDGFFLNPSLLDHVSPEMACYRDEIFGPVLSVVRVPSYDEGAGAHQRQPVRQRHRHLHPRRRRGPPLPVRGAGGHGRRERARSPCRSAAYSFGGWKDSLFGDQHMYGPEGIGFYTRSKVVTQRWPEPADSQIDLGFPAARTGSDGHHAGSSMDIGVVLQTNPPALAGGRPREAGRGARVQPRVDLRLPPAVGGAVRHLQPDPGRDPQGRRRARWSRTRRPATGPSPPASSPRSTRCTATGRCAASGGATRRSGSPTAGPPPWPRCASRST